MKRRCFAFLKMLSFFNVYDLLMSLELDFEEFDFGFYRLYVFVLVN